MQTLTEPGRAHAPRRLPVWLGACLFLATAAFFLWQEHRAHLLGALPYALFLLCPVIHFFMHRGHGDHAGHAPHGDHVDRIGKNGRTP